MLLRLWLQLMLGGGDPDWSPYLQLLVAQTRFAERGGCDAFTNLDLDLEMILDFRQCISLMLCIRSRGHRICEHSVCTGHR